MICVGTPSRADGSIDVSNVATAVLDIAPTLARSTKECVLVIRSTVVPGTTQGTVLPILRDANASNVGLAVNPEFLREGRALRDFAEPDRILIGAMNQKSGNAVAALYEGFDAPVIHTDLATAEMTKYASNTLLATLISFSNEIARICETVPGVDVERVLGTVHQDRRLSPLVNGEVVRPGILSYLKAGAGYGGSCLPKDMRALIKFAKGQGLESPLLHAVNAINDAQPNHLVDMADRMAGGLAGKRVLVLGMSFKDGTDDVRESVGVKVAMEVARRGATVVTADPLVRAEQLPELASLGVRFVSDVEDELKRADICLITTLDPLFKTIASAGGEKPLIIDGRRLLERNLLPPETRYAGIGWQPPAKDGGT
jgi:nucleotide sugar dehydrogenase